MPRSNRTGRSPSCRTCWRAASTIRTGRARRAAWSAASRSACSGWCSRRSGRSITARCIPEEARADLRARCAGHRRDQHARAFRRAQPRHARRRRAKKKPSSAAAGLVVDEDWMARWYLDRLPPHVHNAQALDAWYAQAAAGREAGAGMVAAPTCWSATRATATRFPPYPRARRRAAGGALSLRARRDRRRHDRRRAAAPAQCARSGAAVVAGAGFRRRQGGGADQVAAEGAAPQLRAGAGFRARVRRGAIPQPAGGCVRRRRSRASCTS